ncbi:MAG: efflux RND transporter permease subunit [Gammaproteobacteria bacterium]
MALKRPTRVRTRRPAMDHPAIPHEQITSLGLAGNLARIFITSPLSPMLLGASLFIGLIGLFMTPRQEDPEISVPMIDIFVRYEGASSNQVASLAIDPLERMMSEIPGVKHIYSASEREQGIVTVRFEVGEETGPSIVKVYDKIQSNLDKIPPGVSMPLVRPKGIDDVPILTVTLWSEEENDRVLRALATDVLQRLKEVKNTGQGFIVGGRSSQVRIEVMPEELAGHDISLDQIAETVRTANMESSSGGFELGSYSYSVTAGSFLRNADEVGRLVIATRYGNPVYIADVARVISGPQETRNLVTYISGPAASEDIPVTDAAPAVTVAIAKKEGSNGVTVANDLIEKLESLKGIVIPHNVNVTITRNYGKTANDKVNELLSSLIGAALAVTLLSWLTIGARPAIVVATIIPVVILITVWSAWALGYTINRVSLFALIFSIGILVDDATVVVENIFRRWLHGGETSRETAIDAVREVGNPTIIATLTVLAALLPMGLVSGMMGPYMLPIPLFGSVAMLFSLFAAFVFTPWFAYKLRPRLSALRRAETRERNIQDFISRLYTPVISSLIRGGVAAKLFLALIIVAFFSAGSLFYTKAVAVKMLPFDNKPEFNVVVNMPEGTSLPNMVNTMSELVEELKRLPEVTALQSYTGTASPFNFNGMVRHYYLREKPWEGDIQVMLLHKDQRDRSSHEIAEAARALLTPIAERADARIAVVEMPPGPPVLQTVVAEVYGPDQEIRQQVASDLEQMFKEAPGLVDVDTYMSQPYKRWHFEVDAEKATRHGVSVEAINRNLDMAMGNYRIGDVKTEHELEPTYIVMQLPMDVRALLSRLYVLPIRAADGSMIPLSELGEFQLVDEDPVIYHKDLRPMEYVVGEMEGKLGAPIYGMMAVEKSLNDYTAPDGIAISGTLTGPPPSNDRSGFEWSGEWVVTYETFRDMGIAFAAALVLIYILLVWEFGNYIHPAIIMAPIPLTLIGIIPGHWIMNAEFTATSMIGFIALAGIEVRNSILLVDFARNEVHRGADYKSAVMDAGKIRMRPIWVTDLTMMAGAVAILFDPIFEGMAISLLFGPIIAVPLTMLVVPLGCMSACKAFGKLRAEGSQDALERDGNEPPPSCVKR